MTYPNRFKLFVRVFHTSITLCIYVYLREACSHPASHPLPTYIRVRRDGVLHIYWLRGSNILSTCSNSQQGNAMLLRNTRKHTLGHESNGIGYFIPVKYIITHMTWLRGKRKYMVSVLQNVYRMCSRPGKSLSLNFVPLNFIVCAAHNNIPRYFLILYLRSYMCREKYIMVATI